jgi:hypothetical protein
LSARDLLASVERPTSAELLAARSAAGLTQAQAAALCGLGSAVRWSEYERGPECRIDLARWALFLLAVGQHPTARLAGR